MSKRGDIVPAPAEFYADGALEVIHAILTAGEWDADAVSEVADVFAGRGWPVPELTDDDEDEDDEDDYDDNEPIPLSVIYAGDSDG